MKMYHTEWGSSPGVVSPSGSRWLLFLKGVHQISHLLQTLGARNCRTTFCIFCYLPSAICNSQSTIHYLHSPFHIPHFYPIFCFQSSPKLNHIFIPLASYLFFDFCFWKKTLLYFLRLQTSLDLSSLFLSHFFSLFDHGLAPYIKS